MQKWLALPFDIWFLGSHTVVDGLVVAMDLVAKFKASQKKCTCRIVMLTDAITKIDNREGALLIEGPIISFCQIQTSFNHLIDGLHHPLCKLWLFCSWGPGCSCAYGSRDWASNQYRVWRVPLLPRPHPPSGIGFDEDITIDDDPQLLAKRTQYHLDQGRSQDSVCIPDWVKSYHLLPLGTLFSLLDWERNAPSKVQPRYQWSRQLGVFYACLCADT